MFDVIQAIRAKAAAQGFAPAIINGERVIPGQLLLELIVRVGNHFIDRRVPPRARLYVNVADPDLRLMTALAAIYAGAIPLILADPSGLGAGLDYDLVVGSPVPLSAGLPADLVVDESVLGGKLTDASLRPTADLAPGGVLYVAGTSGTTGRRKLVAERAGAYLQKERIADLGLRESDIVMMTLGDSSKAGFGISLRVLRAGAALQRDDANPEISLRYINLFGTTRIMTTPVWLSALVEAMLQKKIRAPSVEKIHLTGSLVPSELIGQARAAFENVPIEVIYGSSEAGAIARGRLDLPGFRPGYVGELIPEVELAEVGSPGLPAQIVLRKNRDVFCEYFIDGRPLPDNSAAYPMPDVGFLDGRSLYLTGRHDEVANLSGNKIAFAVIEEAVRRIAGATDVGLANAPAEWDLPGVIVGVAGSEAEFSDLSARLVEAVEGSFASHFHLVRLPTIPRNDMGKVDRGALLAEYRKATPAAVD